ncbi:MAG: tRNA lysidine(34) synthetase TilS [Sphingomonas bacterium]|nr:tRNA lysidine(34) synthetase TilS [Sphingomonas bacterium]
MEQPAPARQLGVAVSGGGDSLALLLLAHAAFPGRVAAATVDHELRREAAAEAQHVERLCASLGMPHATLRLGPQRSVERANLQDRARATRYWLLGEWAAERGVTYIATGHQRDDVAESFLMRAARGAGVTGMAAMRTKRPNDGPGYRTVIVRPLLTWSRAELAEIVGNAKIAAVDDPSNVDPRFDRARMRLRIADDPDLPPDRLARAAANLRHVEDALEWVMDSEVKSRFELAADDTVWLQADGLPFELSRRLVRAAIDEVRLENGMFDEWRDTSVPDLVRSLEAGRGGTIADVQARISKGRWHFRPAPPRRTG